MKHALWEDTCSVPLSSRKVKSLCSGKQPTLWPGWWDATPNSWGHPRRLQTPGTRRRLLSCKGFLKLYFLLKKQNETLPIPACFLSAGDALGSFLISETAASSSGDGGGQPLVGGMLSWVTSL